MAPLTTSVVYTANPAPPGRKASPQFNEIGANGMVPSEIGSVKISLINTDLSAFFLVFQFFWAMIASLNNSVKTGLKKAVTLSITAPVPFLFPRPALGVTVSKLTEDIVLKLEAAGFSKRIAGRQVYYTGPSTPEAVQTAVRLGCATDARVPSNVINVDGAVALSVINRIMYQALRILSPKSTVPLSVANSFELKDVPATPWFTEANLDELPSRGVFFSYFDGLLLPDRSHPINTLMRRFSNLLGETPARIEASAKTLSRGWASLHDTATGRALSHVILCIDLALNAGLRLTPVFLNGEYSGCVIEGDRFMVVQTSGIYIPGTKEAMSEAISKLGSHDAALQSIAELLSQLPLRENGEMLEIGIELLQTPRAIHNQTRLRKVDSANQGHLLGFVKKLRFRQAMWDVRNSKHIVSAVRAIMTKEFLDQDAPCNIAGDGLWTTNPIYSTLLAFGVLAPSLRGTGSSLARHIAKDMYTAVVKPGKLTGIPIFFKKPREALEDWEDMMTSQQVWFNHKQADKEGKLRIVGLGMSVPFGPDADNIMKSLMLAAGKKRKREEGEKKEPTKEQKEESDRSKRAKLDGYAGLFEGLGSHIQSEDADVDYFAIPEPEEEESPKATPPPADVPMTE